MARIGRPKTNISKQELYGAFARMNARDRDLALEVMQALHGALTPESSQHGSGEPRTPALSAK